MYWRNPSGFLQADYGWRKKVNVNLQFLKIQQLQAWSELLWQKKD
jgi:hypothetical protein